MGGAREKVGVAKVKQLLERVSKLRRAETSLSWGMNTRSTLGLC